MSVCARFAGALLLCACLSAQAGAGITRADWGTTARGEKVEIYTLTGAGGLEARISNFGGVIVTLNVPDRNGSKTDVMLGYDDLASYETGGVYGAVIGRYANRIGSNGTFPLDGRTIHLERGTPDQQIVIHGGTAGFQKKVWRAEMHDGAEPSLTLTVVSPDGDGGFPGALTTTLVYTVTRDNALTLEYRAVSDRPTVVNLTNHAYFALQGEGHGEVSDQVMQVFADRYTPSGPDNLPTGDIALVADTPLDFRTPVRLGDILDSRFDQIALRRGLDINMIVNGTPGVLRPAARISDPTTGILMEVFTTQPGMQLYSDNVTRTVPGKGGRPYGNRYAMSFETQHYPDSPNRPEFPSTVVTPSTPLHEVTVYRFSTAK
ncbi:MAG: galactose mutarotase [Acidobacteria bacterium]|nr:galactose mutarotase [Acidobacteriota bacterium]